MKNPFKRQSREPISVTVPVNKTDPNSPERVELLAAAEELAAARQERAEANAAAEAALHRWRAAQARFDMAVEAYQ